MVEAVVVDDSHFMRVQIADILEEGGVSVIGEARNGKEALATVIECEPDVVTMDVKMPGVDGIEAVERIMESRPTPILMLSRYTEDGAETTLEALDAGAVDFFPKPDGEVSPTLHQYADELVEAVTVVANAEVPSTPIQAGTTSPDSTSTKSTETPATVAGPVRTPDTPPTIVIAASTGGPPEVQSILSALPASLGCRVLVVQHMPAGFTDRFADRLDTLSELDVREVQPDDCVGRNEALVAKGECHLEVVGETDRGLEVDVSETPPVHSVRPAADVTFETIAKHCTPPLLGIVLSGMGHDGAAGMEAIESVGGTTIVQDPEDARLPAMPRRAIETGVVDTVVPAVEIPRVIADSIENDRNDPAE